MSNVIINPFVFATVYTANPVSFDGSTHIERDGEFTAVSDGGAGTVSLWINMKGGDGSAVNILANTGGFFGVQRNTSNVIAVFAATSVPVEILRLTGTTTMTITPPTGWHHVCAAWDLSTPEAHLFVDDANDEASSTETSGTLDYTRGDWGVGASVGGGNRMTAHIADLWFDDTFVDISDTATRRKFINASGKPVNLGSDGSIPTGAAPVCFFSGDTSTWHVNDARGSDGMTETAGDIVDGTGPVEL